LVVSFQTSLSAAGEKRCACTAPDAKPRAKAQATAKLSGFLVNEVFMFSLDE
jgi:hypothetical protein